jgi:hypothetical protein
MRSLIIVCLFALAIGAGCQKHEKITAQEAAIAVAATEQMNASAAAVAQSRYRTYRWMTSEEMVRSRLGYDPTMGAGTRYAVEQAVDDNLAQKGFEQGEPADLLVAFNDVYINRNVSTPDSDLGNAAIEASDGVSNSQLLAYRDMEIYRTPEEGFTISFFDAQTRRLIWRGVAREHFATMEGTQSDEAIETAVYRALENMPVPLAP